jgi:hypothetical protein
MGYTLCVLGVRVLGGPRSIADQRRLQDAGPWESQ